MPAVLGCKTNAMLAQVLKHRVEALLQAGRNVVLTGDLNIAPYAIDHCDLVRASCVFKGPTTAMFVQVLKHRMEALLQAGRNVVLAGDLNIAPYAIDHCDLVRASRKEQEAMLEGRPDRAWFRNALQSAEGPFVDLFRCALVLSGSASKGSVTWP